MKDKYRWNYSIRVKTKDGTYEYEEDIENIDKNYEEIQAIHKEEKCKKKVLKKQ